MRIRLQIDVETNDWATFSKLVGDQPPVQMWFPEDGPTLSVWGRLVGAEEAYDALIELRDYERGGT